MKFTLEQIKEVVTCTNAYSEMKESDQLIFLDTTKFFINALFDYANGTPTHMLKYYGGAKNFYSIKYYEKALSPSGYAKVTNVLLRNVIEQALALIAEIEEGVKGEEKEVVSLPNTNNDISETEVTSLAKLTPSYINQNPDSKETFIMHRKDYIHVLVKYINASSVNMIVKYHGGVGRYFSFDNFNKFLFITNGYHITEVSSDFCKELLLIVVGFMQSKINEIQPIATKKKFTIKPKNITIQSICLGLKDKREAIYHEYFETDDEYGLQYHISDEECEYLESIYDAEKVSAKVKSIVLDTFTNCDRRQYRTLKDCIDKEGSKVVLSASFERIVECIATTKTIKPVFFKSCGFIE